MWRGLHRPPVHEYATGRQHNRGKHQRNAMFWLSGGFLGEALVEHVVQTCNAKGLAINFCEDAEEGREDQEEDAVKQS